MEREKKEAEVFPVWVDWEHQIVSFREAGGFEKLEYPNHDEMFRFALERSMSGFSIQ